MLTFLHIKTIPPYAVLIYTRRSNTTFGDKVSSVVAYVCVRDISSIFLVSKCLFYINANSVDRRWKISNVTLYYLSSLDARTARVKSLSIQKVFESCVHLYIAKLFGKDSARL